MSHKNYSEMSDKDTLKKARWSVVIISTCSAMASLDGQFGQVAAPNNHTETPLGSSTQRPPLANKWPQICIRFHLHPRSSYVDNQEVVSYVLYKLTHSNSNNCIQNKGKSHS